MSKIFVGMCLSGLLVLAILIFLMVSKGGRSGEEQPVPSDDPILKPLQARNPTLRIEKRLRDDFDRVPVFWAVDPQSGRSVMLPRDEVEESKIEFLPTREVDEIPERLRYPKSTEPVCVQVTDEHRKLNAFYFEAKGRLRNVVTYYDGPGKSPRGSWEHGYRQEKQPDGSQVFAYSYFAYETSRGRDFLVRAFVGYKETK